MANFDEMTVKVLDALIVENKGEWEQIEFKKTTGELQGGMETLCGFLNGSGGKVLFGVNNAGKILGQETGDSTFQEIANAIRKIEPSAWIEQIRVPVDSKREVIVLATSVHRDVPYTFDGRAYQRSCRSIRTSSTKSIWNGWLPWSRKKCKVVVDRPR